MGKPGDIGPRYDGPAAALDSVTVLRRTVPLVQDIDWRAQYGQHWVVFGRNGAGKTTIMQVASGTTFPSRGSATVLGHRMGRVDLRSLRKHVGLVTTKQRLPDEERCTAETVVLTGHTGTVVPLWSYYDDDVRERARGWLDVVGCGYLQDRSIRACSQGERARVRLARALMADPTLLILDEPFAGLDMPAREDLLHALEELPATNPTLTTVLVTHHVEEIPRSTSHALLLRDGRVTRSGPFHEAFTEESLGQCLDRKIRLTEIDGRWAAQVPRSLSWTTVGGNAL